MNKYILAMDQGTTSSRAIVFDHDGKLVGSQNQEFEQIYPKDRKSTRLNSSHT